MDLGTQNEKWWMRASWWLLLFGSWGLICYLLGKDTRYSYDLAFMQLGPARIVGPQAVIYQEASAYLYTNPVATIKLLLKLRAISYGQTLLMASLATLLMGAAFRLRGNFARGLLILFSLSMLLTVLYLAVLCVWEWSMAWVMLILCARFLPHMPVKCRFTLSALIAALLLLGWHRMDWESETRQYNTFWNRAAACDRVETFTEAFGKPIFMFRHMSEEDKRWLDSLAYIDNSLWHPGKNLYGFVLADIPDILLLPWFDDDGRRVALAWCDLTSERRIYITETVSAAEP